MADKQATPDVVVKKRASELGRKVMVGTFSNYAGPVDENVAPTSRIKAVWRNETGAFHCATLTTRPT
ncbi:MAG: hypothetical protein WA790_18685 [Sulfitobacter sp.]